MGESDAALLRDRPGLQLATFLYLGGKHMVTGLDHVLFLLGVIFFLYRPRDVVLYITLFSLGHSVALLAGATAGWRVDPYLIDAIIGLSVAYKAFDNLGGFQSFFGVTPDNRVAVSVFGLFHGLGLATKIEDLQIAAEGFVPNLLAFNLGVEAGQLLVLMAMLTLIALLRTARAFGAISVVGNSLLLFAGLVLVQTQLVGFFLGEGS